MNLFYFLVFGVIAYIVWSRQRARAVQQEEVLALVEQRAASLMEEFPDLDDDAIALLIRDELQNRRVRGHEAYAAASAHPVGRVRRSLVVASARSKKSAPKKLPPTRIESSEES